MGNTKTGKPCSDAGECVIAGDGASAQCKCNVGVVGSACDSGCAVGSNKLPCSGHGECELLGNQGGCKCASGWSGPDCGNRICTATNAVFNGVTGECVCPPGNICCAPQELESKRAKESRIRALQHENEELQQAFAETTRMLAETKR